MKLLDAQLAAGVKVDAAHFAREHGVSARTVYRHRARIQAEGEWRERSRRPRASPRATSADLEAWILKLRADLGVDNGADHIRDALIEIHARTSPAWSVPARSTINRVLSRHDKLERNPKKRPRSSWRRFSYARPRDCYQIDATEVKLADASAAVVFEVLDDCTRLLAASHAAPAETAEAATAAMDKAIDEYGAPAIVLSDNGTAFTSRLTKPGTLSSFVRALHRRRIRPINSSPYHPQTCGKVERHHQTFKKWLRTQPPPETIEDLQNLCDRYRKYYNTQRRHSALRRRSTPQQAWDAAASYGGPSSLPVQTDATLQRCKVATNGGVSIGRHTTSVGVAYAGTTVTTVRDGDHVTVYTAEGEPIGHVHLDPNKRFVMLSRVE